jgi:hypothetical protein
MALIPKSTKMILQPMQLQDRACEPTRQFYTCVSNGFSGCCSVDPCNRIDCPDSVALGPSLGSGHEGFQPQTTRSISTSPVAARFSATIKLQRTSTVPAPVTSPKEDPDNMNLAPPAVTLSTVKPTGTILRDGANFTTSTVAFRSTSGSRSSVSTGTAVGSFSSGVALPSIGSRPSLSPTSKKIVAGLFGSLGALAFLGLFLWLLFRWSKRGRKRPRQNSFEDGPEPLTVGPAMAEASSKGFGKL